MSTQRHIAPLRYSTEYGPPCRRLHFSDKLVTEVRYLGVRHFFMLDNFPAFDWILKMRAQVFYHCLILLVILISNMGDGTRSKSNEKILLFFVRFMEE